MQQDEALTKGTMDYLRQTQIYWELLKTLRKISIYKFSHQCSTECQLQSFNADDITAEEDLPELLLEIGSVLEIILSSPKIFKEINSKYSA